MGTHSDRPRRSFAQYLVQSAVVAVELPSDVAVRVDHYPRAVLSQPNAARDVECLAQFVFEFRWYAAPYRTVSWSACEVAEVLAEGDEA
jgi:hypothetical protein